jgi:hypothetical protein
MGSGNRKSNTQYVAPSVAGDMSAVCPGRFSAVSMMTHAPVLADVGYEVVLAGDAVAAVKGDETVASVLAAPGNLIAALGAGCRYVATFGEATDTGRVVVAEVLLIE